MQFYGLKQRGLARFQGPSSRLPWGVALVGTVIYLLRGTELVVAPGGGRKPISSAGVGWPGAFGWWRFKAGKDGGRENWAGWGVVWLNAAEEATVRLLETVNHSHLPEPIAVFCDLSLFRSLSLYRSLYVSLSLSISLSISPTYGISLCFISVSLCVCMCICVCLLVCYSMCVFIMSDRFWKIFTDFYADFWLTSRLPESINLSTFRLPVSHPFVRLVLLAMCLYGYLCLSGSHCLPVLFLSFNISPIC